MKLIKREHYLNRLLLVKDIPDIKIITGVRRCGKSRLMDAFTELIDDGRNKIVRIKVQAEPSINPTDASEFENASTNDSPSKNPPE